MYSNSSSDPLTAKAQLIILFIIIVAGIISFYLTKYFKQHNKIDLEDTPILLAYYTDSSQIVPIQKGKFGNLKYIALSTIGQRLSEGFDGVSLIYVVDLPFATKIHLLGIPKRSGATQLDPGGLMEPVVLEGNFSEYFSLFAEKGMQAEARYVLDPAAMEFIVDFCQSHNWEISGNQLYFVMTNKMNNDQDPTSMYDDLPKFIEQIRPAIESPAPIQPDPLKPKFIRRVEEYNCPICSQKMIAEKDFYRCPNHDGIFLIGGKIDEVKDGQLPNPAHLKITQHGVLTCPACGSRMDEVSYGGSKTIINSCSNCAYRWLDAGELAPKLTNN